MRAGATSMGAFLAGALILVGCSSAQPAETPAVVSARDLSAKVTVDGMFAHLQRLSDIAAAHDGSRADGTAGYDASVEYVSDVLRKSGFDVKTVAYDRVVPGRPGRPSLVVAGRTSPVVQASLLTPTAPGGLTALSLRPPRPAGCSAADYGSVNVRGAIAVVDDGGCSVVDKQNAAVGAGAVGVLVVSAGGPDGSPAGLFPSGYYAQLKVPVAVVDPSVDALLRRTEAPVRLTLDGESRTITSRNVLAQTKTGDGHNVVVAGAHLGSAPGSPGLNDDGTGVAAVLETAVQLGGSPKIASAVRFAFWGSEEASLAGSTTYVAGLDRAGLDDVALYLNFDAIGSTNPGFFTYDGDQSGPPNPDVAAARVPKGSAGIERTLAGYLNLAGVHPADMPLSRASDYSPFLAAGLPVGGLTTGTSQRKTEAQQRIWGGKAGAPFDPNYRTPRDGITNVDRATLAITGPAVAFAVATYAQSTDGANGVPARG